MTPACMLMLHVARQVLATATNILGDMSHKANCRVIVCIYTQQIAAHVLPGGTFSAILRATRLALPDTALRFVVINSSPDSD